MTLGPLWDELLSISSPAIGLPDADVVSLPEELATALTRRNGFFAFESALHFLPSKPAEAGATTVQAWNAPTLWKSSYGGMADGLYCFAEDVFCVATCRLKNRVHLFGPR
jgi:hypothetical protein